MAGKLGGIRKNAKVRAAALEKLGIGPLLGLQPVNQGACTGKWISCAGGQELVSISPANGAPIASVLQADEAAYEKVVAEAAAAFSTWRMMPAPTRGEVVRDLGNELRTVKEPLGKLVSLEMGKILSEGLGEVQEMIDMCDFAVGLSRQLYGLTMHSERPRHRMYEQWHPLGVVGIITAFNFPVAVWAWNAALAAVCGDTMVWKPSSDTPLTAVAVQNICNRVMERHRLRGIFNLVIGPGRTVGETLHQRPARAADLVHRLDRDGPARRPRPRPAASGARILELGGNNAIIVEPDADLDLALRAVLFGAVGTAGQRCTSPRRLFLHKTIAKQFLDRLVKAYGSITHRRPARAGRRSWDPLVNAAAVKDHLAALATVREQGGKILCGGGRVDRPGFFVEPTIVKRPSQIADRPRGDLRADPLRHRVRQPRARPSPSTTRSTRACPRRSSPEHVLGGEVPVARGLATAASPTSTSAPPGPRSAAPSAARRRPAAAARRDRTPGRPTCGGRPAPSTGATELPLAQGVKFDV